jgi:hypothetical protein
MSKLQAIAEGRFPRPLDLPDAVGSGNSMDTDDKKDLNRDPLAPRLTPRGVMPHRAPKLKLIVTPEWELYQALRANDPRRVSDALAHGADANASDPGGRMPLYRAVLTWNDPAIAEALLDRGADPRVRDNGGGTPLHLAAVFGEEAHMRVLLAHGAEIDARDNTGMTPLHCAARVGRATFLVKRGADVSLRDNTGMTPLALVRSARYLGADKWREQLERVLGGFLTARVVEARGDLLIVRVEGLHSKYPEAKRQAREGRMLTIPAGLLPEPPDPGEYLKCHKTLTQDLSEAWRETRRRDLGLELVR